MSGECALCRDNAASRSVLLMDGKLAVAVCDRCDTGDVLPTLADTADLLAYRDYVEATAHPTPFGSGCAYLSFDDWKAARAAK